MWILKKLTKDGALHYFVSEKGVYSLGRKNSDIVLTDDSSISRTHCVIQVKVKNECPFSVDTHTGMWIIDHNNAKYGTYIKKHEEWSRIQGKKIEKLKDGDIVRFGLLENIWRLEYKPFIICTSRMPSEQIQELKSLLPAVDGIYYNNWTEHCTFLFVNDITLTVKVLLALINGVPIVTLQYLKEVIKSVRENKALPECELFEPPISESTLVPHLVLLHPKNNRKLLFKGKRFFIPTKEQLENLREIIQAAGGTVEILQLTGNWRSLADDNVIVLQLPYSKIINPDENAKNFKNLASILKNEYHVRVVPETEIFQAIAYASISKYCNPKSRAFEIRQSSENNSYGDIIEEETPSQTSVDNAVHHFVVNSSSELSEPVPSTSLEKSNINISSDRKRYRSPESTGIQRKRLARETDSGNWKSDSPSIQVDNLVLDLFSEEVSKEFEFSPNRKMSKESEISSSLQNLEISKKDCSKNNSGASIFRRIDPRDNENPSSNIDDEPCSIVRKDAKKSFTSEREKRKHSLENSDCPMLEKKKRSVDEDKHTDVIERTENKRAVGTSQSSKKIHSKADHLKTREIANLHGSQECTDWIRRKNAPVSDDVMTFKSRETRENIRSFQKFKKVNKNLSTSVELTKEQRRELEKILSADGWLCSMAGRNQALKCSN